jgi:hypothetical protein
MFAQINVDFLQYDVGKLLRWRILTVFSNHGRRNWSCERDLSSNQQVGSKMRYAIAIHIENQVKSKPYWLICVGNLKLTVCPTKA